MSTLQEVDILLRMRNISDKVCRQNQNTYFIFNNFFFRKSFRLWDNVEKYCRAGQSAFDEIAHAHCILDNLGYQHIFRIHNTAFPMQQWLYEYTSMLLYTYTLFVLL